MGSNSMTVEEFRARLKSGSITTGNKGRLVMNDDTPLPVDDSKAIPQDLMFNPDEYLFIPGEVYSSKNSTQIRTKFVSKSKWKVLIKGVWRYVQPFVAKSDNAKGYQKDKASVYLALAPDFKIMCQDQGFPVFIEMIFIRRTRGIFDFNNISQLVCDCIVDAGWIGDDSVRYMFAIPPLPPYLPYYVDKKNAGVYIKIVK